MLRMRFCSIVIVVAVPGFGAASALGFGGNNGTVCGGGGPDVIVGDLTGPANYSSVGGIEAFSVGTTSCNIGSQNLNWIASNNQHPVIAQNMYRLKDGRFEQVGVGWLKHGFTALTGNLCGCGCNGQGGSVLGVGCSDPYTASRNGFQGWPSGGLGPRFEVNSHTGVFTYPYTFRGVTGNSIFKRVQVQISDLDPAVNGGGLYFMSGQYIAPDDAGAGNGDNNESYRQATISGSGSSWSASFSGSFPTQREQAAIRAWGDNEAGVTETNVRVPGEGLFILAAKATDLGNGFWHYEYAVQNLNSDRSERSFSVPVPDAATVQNIGFHDVFYHSGDGFNSTTANPVTFDGTDWSTTHAGGFITWETQTFAANPNANALRWGTLYNFRFDVNLAPDAVQGTVTLGLFKPGTPTTVNALTVVPVPEPPALAITLPNDPPSLIMPGKSVTFKVEVTPGAENIVPGSPTLHYRYDGGAFQTSALTPLGGDLYNAELPTVDCGDMPEFYVSASGDGGTTVTSPTDAPATTFSAQVGAFLVVFDSEFEIDPGWTVTGDATDGQWELGVPVNNDRGDPPSDSDGSGQCYLTRNDPGDVNSDVDDGTTTLTTEAFDLSNGGVVSYAYWLNDIPTGPLGPGDTFDVEYATDAAGTNWQLVRSYDTASSAWRMDEIAVGTETAASATYRLRFSVTDASEGDVVEGGLDAMHIEFFECVSVPVVCTSADMNDDGSVDGRDIPRFTQIVVGTGDPATDVEICAGDLDDSVAGVGMEDTDEFVTCLLNAGCGD